MKIIGFSITKISAERKKPAKGKLEIKNGLSIEAISESKIEALSTPALKFDFSYTLNYEPSFAEIKILGSVIGLDDKNEAPAILKDWKEKKFSGDTKISIINYIMEECNIRALNLEKELALPFHLPFPKIRTEAKPTSASYTG
jgi:hypothetical protein